MWTSIAILAAALSADPQPGSIKLDGATVSFSGIEADQANAIGRVVAAAREVAKDKFRFDMPQAIQITVRVERDGHTRLFNDGQDRLFLTLKSDADLQPPSKSGVFVLYGLCHEVAHLAMYRPVKDRGWMTTAAAEGWAHYLGSRLVDEVYDREGPDVWPVEYDYRADGMRRLEKQFTGKSAASPTVLGARLWRNLAGILGDEGFAPLFAAWGKAQVDAANPAKALREPLNNHPKKAAVAKWWTDAQKSFFIKRAASGFAAQTTKASELSGKPREMVHDDDRSAGQKSIAGSGHAVRFDAGGDGWYLTSVRLFGARYGAPKAPPESFKVTLCDEKFQRVAEFQFPFGTFDRGDAKWVSLPLAQPTRVPAKFIVAVEFNPTATRGVYVHHDAEGSGESLTGLPGGKPESFKRGDWLMRAVLDQPKAADALR
jgi:RNA polymerase sigma-70 factor (ECF subfamily)